MNIAGQFPDDTRKALRTLWSWLRRVDASASSAVPRGPSSEAAAIIDGKPCESGVVLGFPIRGEALLVKLAAQLRHRIDELAPVSNELSLTLSHHPYLRLTLDRDAHIQFDATSLEFELVIEAAGGTRLILQTTDFDAVVRLVLQYVAERLTDHAPFEVAS